MQSPRRRKSQLHLLIVIILMLIITITVMIFPVNHSVVLQSLADTNKSTTTTMMRTSTNYNSNNNNNNRKVSLQSSNINIIPSSFVVVQKSNTQVTVSDGNISNSSRPTKSTLVLNINRTYYTNTKSKNQLTNLESNINSNNNNSVTGSIFNKDVNIALVAPTFTAAAYDDNSFYTFYNLYNNISAGRNVTTSLNLLSRKITNYDTIRASLVMLKLVDNLKLINPHSHITILTDADVDNGSLFNNENSGNNIHDLVILGHQEYVTQQEYDNLKKFVTNGGTMILLDGNVFFAEVKYDDHTKTESLVKGHWWAFNGKSAWHSIGERWAQETSQWVGSNYLCYRCISAFGNDPFEYTPHEEQYISNQNDSILINYDAVTGKIKIDNKQPTIATYELNYQKGKVVALGIFSDDVIDNTKFNKFFDNLLVRYATATRALISSHKAKILV
jgi:N,N-dimethylformamidase beta subunit-like, C-terminal